MADGQQVDMLTAMGFNESDSRWALVQTGNNVEQAIERLLSGGGEPPPQLPVVDNRDNVDVQDPPRVQAFGGEAITNTAPVYEERPFVDGLDGQDQDLSTALEMSMRDQRGSTQPGAGGSAFVSSAAIEAPAPGVLADQAAAREQELPCGLRNIGNTCYVNSFLQTLLHIDGFRDRILRYRTLMEQTTSAAAPPPSLQEPEAEQGAGRLPMSEAANAARREHCIRLAGELRHLFAYGLFTMRSCIDPTKLLGEMVDDRGEKLPIGSQEDVGEFMLKFLERLDEGLKSGSFWDGVEPAPGAAVKDVADAALCTVAEAAQKSEQTAEDIEMSAPSTLSVAAGTGEAASAPEAGAGAVGAGDVTVAAAQDTGSAGAAAAAPSKDPKDSEPSVLQSLFFGQQVQVFSYRDGPGGAATIGEPTIEVPASELAGGEVLAAPTTTAASDAVVASLPAEGSQAAPEAAPPPAAEQGKLVVSEEKGEFLQIFLDVKHKDLYQAWEASNCTQVDYITPAGSSTEASTTIWIERLPKLLSFQLQRVVFDQEKKVQVKVDESFEFDLTLYVDRFLAHNRDSAVLAAARVTELRERREELSQARSRFQEYQGKAGVGVADVLGLAAECLEQNATPDSAAIVASVPAGGLRLELCDPHRVAAGGMPEAAAMLGDIQAAAPSAVNLLRSLRASFVAQEALLTAEIDRLSEEVADVHRELRQCPFELHAIWVHQGIAGSGHYWAYVRDWRNNRWLRYDDAIVTVVEWEDVRTASIGQAGSNTSAYVLVYVDKELAMQQSQHRDLPVMLKDAEAVLPTQLLAEIHVDNGRLEEERLQQEERAAEQELRQHAEAIFQHYAGLIHKWEPEKRTGDRAGNPHDPNARKFLHDSALLSFQLFLYRLHGEQEVWTYLLSQALDSQLKLRTWQPDEESRILYFLSTTLRSHKCYASMLREKTIGTRLQRCEMTPLDMPKLTAQYNMVLLQAHIIDDALQALKDDGSQLAKTIGALAFIWARWNLEADDKFRQNEVLLIMSTLIYNTITILVRHRDNKTLSEHALATFQATCEYFLLLLTAVEWPNSWKQPLITRLQGLFPQFVSLAAKMRETVNMKETILNHPMTQGHDRLENYERERPEPGEEFFNRHRILYSWLMSADEAISATYVVSVAPSLRDHLVIAAPLRQS